MHVFFLFIFFITNHENMYFMPCINFQDSAQPKHSCGLISKIDVSYKSPLLAHAKEVSGETSGCELCTVFSMFKINGYIVRGGYSLIFILPPPPPRPTPSQEGIFLMEIVCSRFNSFFFSLGS